MTKPRRRQAGEGGISQYDTKAGPRYLIKYTIVNDDGSKKVVLRRRDKDGQPFLDRKAAAAALGDINAEIRKGSHVVSNKVTVGEYLAEWLDGLRKEPSTVSSYRKNVRLHLTPHIGALRLEQLTGTRLTKLYRQLETSGRVDGQGGLSPRTVRYVHTIVHSALGAAVRTGLLARNPADKADPPSAKSAASPEMRYWSAEELRGFLDWSAARDDELHVAWLLLAMTGMRRGEALSLRWSDVDWNAGRVSVQRALSLIRNKGEGEQLLIGPPKAGRPRVVDLDPGTVAALKAHRAARGAIALSLARDDAYVLGNLDGSPRHPERFSRSFTTCVAAARRDRGEDTLPAIRLHDVRHTHASLLLRAGTPVKVVSERLGHANPTITLGTYAHVMPGMQREAADRFAALLQGGA
ncbi:MAG: hypothetical protein QOI06_222 [Nocardioidaceae bacterium]|nr:hypothetical protein [Nocardioidaceae bacterium]